LGGYLIGTDLLTGSLIAYFETKIDPMWRKFFRERHEQEKNGEE
jgi:hypothetical protein